MVLPPETLDDLAVSAIEGAWPFNHIIVECSLKILTVGKHQLAFPFFEILHKITYISQTVTLVVRPEFIDLVEILIVELVIERIRILVEQLPLPLELVLFPHPLIGQFSRLVVQRSKPIHLVAAPVPIIHPPILIVELPLSMSCISDFVPLVPTSLFEGFYHKLRPRLSTVLIHISVYTSTRKITIFPMISLMAVAILLMAITHILICVVHIPHIRVLIRIWL